jgi:hypothetical protein
MRAAAVLLVALPVLAASPSPVASQVTIAPRSVSPVVEGLQTEGRVTRVDRTARRISLDNGDEYAIPPSLDAAWAVIREGSAVRVRYNVDGGQNRVTRVELIE